jgi:hypothetical protein
LLISSPRTLKRRLGRPKKKPVWRPSRSDPQASRSTASTRARSVASYLRRLSVRGRPCRRSAQDTGGARSAADGTPSLRATMTSEWSVRLAPFSSRLIRRSDIPSSSAASSCVQPRSRRISAIRRPTASMIRSGVSRSLTGPRSPRTARNKVARRVHFKFALRWRSPCSRVVVGALACALGACSSSDPGTGSPDGSVGDGGGSGTFVELFFSTTSASPPPCGANWSGASSALHDGLQAPDAQCDCACSAIVACSVQGTPVSGAAPCSTSPPVGSPQTFLSDQCEAISHTFDLNVPDASATCMAAQTVGLPIGWSRNAVACASSIAGSPPSPDPGFTLCVRYDGDVACPSGPYSKRAVEYASVNEMRECTACTCEHPSNISCGDGGTWTVYTDPSCTNIWDDGAGVYVAPGSCRGPVAGAQSAKYHAASPSAACAVSQLGQPTGSAAPLQPTTFCCLP